MEKGTSKVVARVEQYTHNCPELTGRKIQNKLMEGKVCSVCDVPTLGAIYETL